MQFFILIPVIALLVSAAFGAVSITWDSNRRATGSMGAIFVCTGVWALLDLMTFLEPDPAKARIWIEWMHLPALLLGPSVTWLLGQLFPEIGSRLNGLAKAGFSLALLLGVGAVFAPSAVHGIVATEWGSWVARYGWVSILIVPIGTVLPIYAVYEVSRIKVRDDSDKHEVSRASAMTIGVYVSLIASISTEFVLPLLGFASPRLGAVSIACVSALAWLRVLHVSDDLAVTPEGMARSMLAELHDGIVFVDLDGIIVSSNIRFSEMTGRAPRDLVGGCLIDWIEPSLDELRKGLEDRESTLRAIGGDELPVSISSSVARGRNEKERGVVIVFRDLREIDALRRRLLTSGRLAAIGELAAGIAHEVNNPIAFIRSDLNLLTVRVQEVADQVAVVRDFDVEHELFKRTAGRIANALDGIERIAEVVGDVRGFAHVGGAGQGGSDPAALVEGAMRLARLQRGDEVELRLVDTGFCHRIESGQELKQVLLALILILVDGLKVGGRIEATLTSDQKRLRIVLAADPIEESACERIRQIETAALDDVRHFPSEFRLAIAAELIDQLGAELSIACAGPRSMLIELQVPVSGELAQ